MKVAICLSGLLRTYRETYENLVDRLLKPNSAHDIYVFISTYINEDSNNTTERDRRIAWYGQQHPLFPENPIDYKDIYNKYNPTTLHVEQFHKFNVEWAKDLQYSMNLQSFLSMTYKIYMCDRIRRDYEQINGQFDLVVRSRFDTLIPHTIDFNKINPNKINAPSMMQPRIYKDRDWMNDKFAIGNSQNMASYSNWFLNLEQLSKNTPFQPETLLYEHLRQCDIELDLWGREMELVRIKGY